MGVKKELFTGQLLKSFREEAGFIKGIKDESKKVAGNNTLHMVDVGVDPDILINNTAYPIATATRTDAGVAITLDKLETTNTKVSDDELYSLSYDKIKSVTEQHKEVLVEAAGDKAAHSLAPDTDSTKTPVFTTAAAAFGIADIRKMKKKFDANKVPKAGRRLVLCPDHAEALIATNEAFEKQYSLDNKEGRVGRLLGFDVYEYTETPVYNGGTKVAFGAAAAAGDKTSSFAFSLSRAFQAQGKVKMYMNEAEKDPQNRESVVGFRLWNIVLSTKKDAIGAIVSQ